jgi:hypothetical protein
VAHSTLSESREKHSKNADFTLKNKSHTSYTHYTLQIHYRIDLCNQFQVQIFIFFHITPKVMLLAEGNLKEYQRLWPLAVSIINSSSTFELPLNFNSEL